MVDLNQPCRASTIVVTKRGLHKYTPCLPYAQLYNKRVKQAGQLARVFERMGLDDANDNDPLSCT